jgi:enoyl-CoA hydratase/carnithine racemase
MSLILRKENNGIVELTLNRVDQHNALSTELISELQEKLDIESKFSDEFKTRVLIISSASSKAFCAGADLKERLKMSPEEVIQTLDKLNKLMNTIDEISCPSMALIEGVAFGGGLELALACDFRLSYPNAELGLTETRLAIIPGAGGTQRLTQLVGPSKAKQMIFRAKRMSAQEAFSIGLLDYVGDNPKSEIQKWAEEIVQNGPIAVVQAKKVIKKGRNLNLDEGLKVEREGYKVVLKSDDRVEALKAFNEKRKAKFLGK